ncbi:MAG TPA: DUF5317 domain-containing protein [Chloroflexi bacterium]|jgi:hypothetical protein|nr:DUF5317 domain-containing protein [Chloroflexota bacterium]
MILLLALLFSIAIALVRGGRFRWLAQVSLRLGWLAIAAFALQWSIIYAPLPHTEGPFAPRTLILIASYLLVLVVVVVNRRVPGVAVMGIGLGMNLLVMLVNGGFMPVTMEAVERAGLAHLALGTEAGARLMATKDIILPAEATRLWLLSDIFVVPPPLPFRTVFSLGDLFLAVGVFVLFQCAMRPMGERGQHRGRPWSERLALKR